MYPGALLRQSLTALRARVFSRFNANANPSRLLIIDAVGRVGIRQQTVKSGLDRRGPADGRVYFSKAVGSICSALELVQLCDLRLGFGGIGSERLIGILAGMRRQQPGLAHSAKRDQSVGDAMDGSGQHRKITASRRNI